MLEPGFERAFGHDARHDARADGLDHADAEVQTFKHLCNGIFEVKSDGPQSMINVIGIGITVNRRWVEYKFSDKTFDITGSFGAGRIR